MSDLSLKSPHRSRLPLHPLSSPFPTFLGGLLYRALSRRKTGSGALRMAPSLFSSCFPRCRKVMVSPAVRASKAIAYPLLVASRSLSSSELGVTFVFTTKGVPPSSSSFTSNILLTNHPRRGTSRASSPRLARALSACGVFARSPA